MVRNRLVFAKTFTFIKNLEGVQLCRFILSLLNALFILNCKFQNCTAIVQLKVAI